MTGVVAGKTLQRGQTPPWTLDSARDDKGTTFWAVMQFTLEVLSLPPPDHKLVV